MTRIDVVQPRAEGYLHLHAFDEIATSLVEGLRTAGFDSDALEGRTGPGRNIVLGAHLLKPEQLASLPADTIVYNFEQIEASSMMPAEKLGQYAGLEVWDYSTKNVAAWQAAGIDAHHVGVGWAPGLQCIDRTVERDIDVLFYGSINDRRQHVIDELRASGLRVEVAFSVFGAERNALLARAESVINIHFYEAKILEIVRLSFLFANEIPVVSEWSDDLEIPPGFEHAAVYASYDRLVEATQALLDDEEGRRALATHARTCIEAVPWPDMLPHSLRPDSSTPPPQAPPMTPAPKRSSRSGSNATREAVLVLGCHRSGTSMLTRLINLGGYGITGPVIPAAADNPKGFWEDQRVTLLNDQLMLLSGTRWDGLAAPGIVDWRSDPRIVSVRGHLLDHLRSSTHEQVVIKDPRITLLLPFWMELLDELGWETKGVFAVRKPQAVAESLRSRNDFSPVKGILLWLTYTLIGEAFSRALPRVVFDYDRFLNDRDAGLATLHDALSMPVGLEALRRSADDAVDPQLNRSTAGGSDYGFRAAQVAQRAHRALLDGDAEALDALTAQYLDALELFLPMLNGMRSAAESALSRYG